jgi:hypothetical protein
MKRVHLLLLGSVVFLVAIALFTRVSKMSSSADETCRQVMIEKSGYGPWHPLPPPADEQANNSFFTTTTRSYSDGVNTTTCGVQRLGPVWYANGSLGQTFVGFNFGLDPACDGLSYPIKAYGVLSGKAKSAQEIQQEFHVFAKKVHDEVCQKASSSGV